MIDQYWLGFISAAAPAGWHFFNVHMEDYRLRKNLTHMCEIAMSMHEKMAALNGAAVTIPTQGE